MSWRTRTYEVLPALSVRRRELRHSLRLVTMGWMFGVVWLSCISGDQARAFARMLGFNDFAFGLMGALPFIATLGQLYAAVFIERTGLRKYAFIQWATIHRLLWLAVAAVPVFLSPGWAAVTVALGIMAVSHFLGALSTPGWMTWMGDLIPRRIRGRYFARRAQAAQLVQIVAVVALSIALDAGTAHGLPETIQSQGRLMTTICIIFAIGAVFGAIDILTFWRIREVLPPQPSPLRASDVHGGRHGPAGWWRALVATFHDLLIDPLKDRVFRNFVSYGAVITFTVTVSSWFFWRLSTEGLGFSKLGTNCLFMVIGPLAGTLAAMGWGKLQDRWGRRPVLIVATIGTTISLLPWFFASRHLGNPQFLVDFINWISTGMGRLWGWDNWQLVGPGSPLAAYLLCALGCIIGGAAWTGVGLAQTGVVLGFSDGHGRSKYVAASAVLISVGGTLGGLVGGTVAQSLEFLHVHPIRLGLFEWNNWHVTFAISVIGRLASLAWLANMPDPGARSVRDMLRYWSENVYNSVFSRMFFPLRIFGWGRPDEDGQGERKR